MCSSANTPGLPLNPFEDTFALNLRIRKRRPIRTGCVERQSNFNIKLIQAQIFERFAETRGNVFTWMGWVGV